MRAYQFIIGATKFSWKYPRLRGKATGWCYFEDKKILIDSRLRNRKRLECEIHEYIHAAYPDLSEESVTCSAYNLAVILWNLGYRHSFDAENPKTREPDQ
jgi:hypothetical protein